MRARLLAASAVWLLALPAAAQDVGNVVVFGDSLSDPGNIPGLSGGVNFPPSPPYVGNRFSNGPVYSELLPGRFGGTFDPALNFAVGGALTGQDNLNSNRPNVHPGSDLTGVVLPGIATQVDGFLAGGGQLAEDDVVIIYGGSNDVFVAAEAAAALPVDQIPALVQQTAATAATNLGTSVVKLNTVGGETFVLPNLPDIGATPSFTAGGEDSITLGTNFTLAHNLALSQAAANLGDQTGANILVFDINGVFDDILADPERYGITNTTEACIDVAACVTADQETQNQFLFFDSVHPTAGVHAQVAEILATAVEGPATIAAQGDVTLDAGEDFQRALIENLYPVDLEASGRTRSAGAANLDTASDKKPGETLDRPTDFLFLVDHTEGNRDARPGAAGYRDELTSVTAGLRHRLGGLFSLGTALRVGFGDADFEGGDEDFDHSQVQLGLSAAHGVRHSYIAAFANLGYAEVRNIERRTDIDGVETEGSTDGFVYGAGIAAGHLFGLDTNFRLGPEASLRYSAVDLEDYIEDGSSFLIQRVDDQDDVESLIGSIGLAVEFGLRGQRDNGIGDVNLRIAGFLDHNFEDGDRTIDTTLISGPTTITTQVQGRDSTNGRIGADLNLSPIDGVDFGVGFETLVGDDEGEQYSLFGRAVISF